MKPEKYLCLLYLVIIYFDCGLYFDLNMSLDDELMRSIDSLLNKKLVSKRHGSIKRSAAKLIYSLPCVRNNYGKFGIKFVIAKDWNSLDEDFKNLDKTPFKKQLFNSRIT